MNQIVSLTIALLLVFSVSSVQLEDSSKTVGPTCLLCHDIVKTIQEAVPGRSIDDILVKIAYLYCPKVKEYDSTVCKGAIKAMTPFIVKSLWKHYTDPHMVCSELRLCRQEYQKRNLQDDIKRILSNKPENKTWEKPTRRKVLKIMHVSDIHPDLFYTAGAEADCGEPVCCRPRADANLSALQMWEKIKNGDYL